MAIKIPEMLQTRKGREVVLIVAIVLLGLASFGLGRLSVAETAQGGSVALCSTIPQSELLTAAVAQAGSKPDQAVQSMPVAASGGGQYVGSKSGSVYHLPWCSGAKRIKDENKVWFATKAEAEAAGYRPAANCKGI